MHNVGQTMNRRSFLKLLGVSGGALLIGANEMGCAGLKSQDLEDIFAARGVFEPNLFLSIAENGRVLGIPLF